MAVSGHGHHGVWGSSVLCFLAESFEDSEEANDLPGSSYSRTRGDPFLLDFLLHSAPPVSTARGMRGRVGMLSATYGVGCVLFGNQKRIQNERDTRDNRGS